MNFLKTLKFLSVLLVLFVAVILISTYAYVYLFYSNFQEYYTDILVRKHNELITKLTDDFIPIFTPTKEETLLLGIGIIYKDGKTKFYPRRSKVYWDLGQNYLNKKAFFIKTKPIRAENLYFQIISSNYQDKKFVSIFNASPVGFLYDKFKIIRIFIIFLSIVMPIFLIIIFSSAEKFYSKILEEAKENPLIDIKGEEPQVIINFLKKTNEELKTLLEKEKIKYNELEILSNTLSQNLPSGLILLDLQNKVIKVNSYTLKKLDITEFMENTPIEEFLSNHPKSLKLIKEKIEQKEAIVKYSIEEKEKIFDLTIAPLFKEEELLGTLIIFQDLTEVKKLEKTLMQKETLANLGIFAAGIAHEFRNSLSTIIGYGKLIKKDEKNMENQRYLEALLEEAVHINDVITSFLEYTKMQEIEKEECLIYDIFYNVIDSLRTKYPLVNFRITGKNFKLSLDPSLFSQAIKAILENSCYEQKEGDIFINLIEDNDCFKIEIKDFGPGMDEETLEKIFIPFFSTKASGTGLGLFLAHKIITLHNATISVNSKKGKGSNFTIIFNKEVLQNDTLL